MIVPYRTVMVNILETKCLKCNPKSMHLSQNANLQLNLSMVCLATGVRWLAS